MNESIDGSSANWTADDEVEVLYESERLRDLIFKIPRKVPVAIARDVANGTAPLKAWREYRGLRAVELGKRAGITRRDISCIEGGLLRGTEPTLIRLALALDCLTDDLLPSWRN